MLILAPEIAKAADDVPAAFVLMDGH